MQPHSPADEYMSRGGEDGKHLPGTHWCGAKWNLDASGNVLKSSFPKADSNLSDVELGKMLAPSMAPSKPMARLAIGEASETHVTETKSIDPPTAETPRSKPHVDLLEGARPDPFTLVQSHSSTSEKMRLHMKACCYMNSNRSPGILRSTQRILPVRL